MNQYSPFASVGAEAHSSHHLQGSKRKRAPEDFMPAGCRLAAPLVLGQACQGPSVASQNIATMSSATAATAGLLSLKYSQDPVYHAQIQESFSHDSMSEKFPSQLFAPRPNPCVFYPSVSRQSGPIVWGPTIMPYMSHVGPGYSAYPQYSHNLNTYPSMDMLPSPQFVPECTFEADEQETRSKKARLTEHVQSSIATPQLVQPKEFSVELQERIAAEGSDFLDERGYGTWTTKLNHRIPRERRMMIELMRNLYDRPEEGYFINEFFGLRHGQEPHEMCEEYFSQCLVLAKFRISAFSVPKRNEPGQYNTTFDTPELYNKIPGYFDPVKRPMLPLTGKGGGRKKRTGAPDDFEEGVHYFQTRTKAVFILSERNLSDEI